MKYLTTIFLLLSIMFMYGCASGRVSYSHPKNSDYEKASSVIIEESKDVVWKRLVSKVGKSFFVINNIDKESGILNISYSGNPEKYIDCGNITSYVKNSHGERTYTFPAACPHKKYEMVHNGKHFHIVRKMGLSGRMNIIVEELAPNRTMVSINTKYVVDKSVKAVHTIIDSNFNLRNVSESFSEKISFNSKQSDVFPTGGVVCKANGDFENEILSLIVKK